jgi:hypothetical protein
MTDALALLAVCLLAGAVGAITWLLESDERPMTPVEGEGAGKERAK